MYTADTHETRTFPLKVGRISNKKVFSMWGWEWREVIGLQGRYSVLFHWPISSCARAWFVVF